MSYKITYSIAIKKKTVIKYPINKEYEVTQNTVDFSHRSQFQTNLDERAYPISRTRNMQSTVKLFTYFRDITISIISIKTNSERKILLHYEVCVNNINSIHYIHQNESNLMQFRRERDNFLQIPNFTHTHTYTYLYTASVMQ